jgi:hypothetical protein
MGTNAAAVTSQRRWLLSLDGWAVLAAFFAALLIRLGVFRHIPW